MGRLLEQCMSEFSSGDMEVLESLIASNFEDALMIASLSKLQQQQLRISEKLNTVFADSVLKSQQTNSTTQSTPSTNSAQNPTKAAKKGSE
jgi:hypothetical protein